MKKLLKQFGKVIEDVDLKEHNTFKIGGRATYLVRPDTSADVKDLVTLLKEQDIKFYVLGNGSNVIFSDNYFDGVIIKLDKLCAIEVYGVFGKAFAEAGAMMPSVAAECLEESLEGFEWAVGLPGTVGGSVVTNAGCYGTSTFDILKSVTCIDTEGNFAKFEHDEIEYGYRTTMFKENKSHIILVAEFELKKGNRKVMKERITDRRKRRQKEQPLEYPSAGSIFRNPNGEDPTIKEKIAKYKLKGPFAGHLIEECGLKGKKIGGAEVSTKHANFIINTGNATANDVKNLIELVHDEVLKKFEIDLIYEQELVNWE